MFVVSCESSDFAVVVADQCPVHLDAADVVPPQMLSSVGVEEVCI
jgi:hypothetical protein